MCEINCEKKQSKALSTIWSESHIPEVLSNVLQNKSFSSATIRDKVKLVFDLFNVRQISLFRSGFLDQLNEKIEFNEEEVEEINAIVRDELETYENTSKDFELLMDQLEAVKLSDFEQIYENDIKSWYNDRFDKLKQLLEVKNELVPEEFNRRVTLIFLQCQAISYKIGLMDQKLKAAFIEKPTHLNAFETLLNRLENKNKKMKNVQKLHSEKDKFIEQIRDDKEMSQIFDKYILMKKLKLIGKLPSSQ